ncbi:MAG TPA: hypothetical protein VGG14_06575 [Candidatus Sulfotelmatobacter sp.]
MKMLVELRSSEEDIAILRLHKPICLSNRFAPLRMTVLFLFAISMPVFATTYYVSSSTGNDLNSGTSTATAWQTIGQVNAQTFQPGDSVLFKRGDVWNESLVVPSSGAAGNPIAFDAYGTGPAPNLTGYYAVPASAWGHVSGNAWKAKLPPTYSTINFCLFGSIWGQKVAASTSNLTAQWNFYFANGYVYVYATENPSLFYNEAIVPMALSNVPVINTNGQSWLTFQHFLVNWFDQYGVYVQGTSDHLVFANMESDSMIPQGTQPLGFYVNESTPGPGDIKIYNAEAHLNYDGFRFDGAATAITMVNDKAYANRDGALVDNTSALAYSYCHFYASSLAVAGSTDVEWTSGTGPNAGAGNVAADTAPAVQVWQRYPAEVTLTVDDSGMTPGADTYYASTVLPIADAAGVPVGAAITVGYPLAQTLISEFQGWIDAGRDVTSHSISHTYYTNTDALDIQYIGSGTAATLSISDQTLTITVTGATDTVSYDLAQGQPQGTILGLKTALVATGKFTTSFLTPCQGPYGTGCSAYTAAALLSQDLADVSGQDVESNVYHMQLDVTRLTTDEITLARNWMTSNLTGLPPTPVYVYPGGYETTTMQGIAEGVPYNGARGALKQDLGVKDTYANGFNVQNVTSFGVNPSWQGLAPTVLNQKIQALVWKESVWGVLWGVFWHLNELSSTEITNLINDFKASGATIETNTSLVNWLLGGTQVTGTDGSDYYIFPATSTTLDFRPTQNSPVVDAGENLGPAYEIDLNGVNQNSYGTGWEIGAHVYEGYSVYGGGAGSWFTIGSQPTAGAPQLPQLWVDNNEATDGLVYTPPQYELELSGSGGTWISTAPSGCTFTLSNYVTNFTGLQDAVNDIEACRTGTGVGIILDVPPGLYTTASSNGLVIPQTANATANSFLVLRSTQDANLPNGQTVCSHGIQDNLATSTDIGLDNPDCAGDVMYYQLGTTQTAIPSGAFTLANGTATNTSAYDDVQYMWTAQCSGTNCSALITCSPIGSSDIPACASTTIAPDHWLIGDMEARPSVGNATSTVPINMSEVGTETSLSQLPTHIHLRRVWAHGDWTSLSTGANSIVNAIQLGCVYCSLVDSQISQILRPGAEGHGIGLRYAVEHKINHNWIEGASSALFAGGYATVPSIPGLIMAQDEEWRRNRFTFPYAWLGQDDSSCGTHGVGTVPHTNPNWGCTSSSGFSIERKNAQEFKEGERVLADGNIYENVDNSGGQSGVIHVETVRDCSGTSSPCANYQAAIVDITDSNNIYRNGCEGMVFDDSGTNPGTNGGGVSPLLARISLSNSLIYNVTTTNPGCGASNSVGITASSELFQWKGTITENSVGTAATFTATCSVDGGDCPSGPPSIGYGQFDLNPGDPVSIKGCTAVTAFNVATHTVGGQTVPVNVGPGAAAGTLPSALAVSYPWTATANATDTSGNCILTKGEGGPLAWQMSHVSFVTDSTHALTAANTPSIGPNFGLYSLVQNDITLGSGWFNNPVGVGTPTEDFDHDANSLTGDHAVWPTQTSSSYTAYGNNPSFPAGSPVLYFPATPYCTGATSSSTCVGFVGAMNASSMPLTLPDYHQFELRSDSVFYAGGAEAAADGTSMGANIPAIDGAQTESTYVCRTPCGLGPFHD